MKRQIFKKTQRGILKTQTGFACQVLKKDATNESELMGLLKPLIPIDALPFCIKGWGGQRCTWARSAACGRRWFTPPFFTRPPLTPFNEP